MPTFTDWPDGKRHKISYAQHLINMRAKAGNPMTLPPPPVGTYDPSIDYNASAARRGYDQTFNDAQTLFERGGQDYGLDLGDLTRSRDYSLADLLTRQNRLEEDFKSAGENVGRQYGILGRRVAENAARQGVTSAGILEQSNAVRNENKARDDRELETQRARGLQEIGTARDRTNTAFAEGKTRLDLGQARQFGGFGGFEMINPLTGRPEFGSLLTSLTRAGTENNAYQTAAEGQRAQQAADRGYVSPLTKAQPGAMYIGGTPVTPQMWQSGLLLEALTGGKPASSARPAKPRFRPFQPSWGR